MNIFEKERWSKFKQELIPIIYVSTFQIWWNFNFPPIIRLGTPWSTVLGLSLSIVITFVYIFTFSFADKYASQFNLEYLDGAPEPYGPILKKIERIGLIAIAHISMFFVWYNDLYGMSNIYYALCYAYCLTGFVLMARAINRPKNIDRCEIIE